MSSATKARSTRLVVRDPLSVFAALSAVFSEVGFNEAISAKEFVDVLDVRGLIGWPAIGVSRGRGRGGALLRALVDAGLLEMAATPIRDAPRWKYSKLGVRLFATSVSEGRALSLEEARSIWKESKL